jgi:hypothetical protein
MAEAEPEARATVVLAAEAKTEVVAALVPEAKAA